MCNDISQTCYFHLQVVCVGYIFGYNFIYLFAKQTVGGDKELSWDQQTVLCESQTGVGGFLAPAVKSVCSILAAPISS